MIHTQLEYVEDLPRSLLVICFYMSPMSPMHMCINLCLGRTYCSSCCCPKAKHDTRTYTQFCTNCSNLQQHPQETSSEYLLECTNSISKKLVDFFQKPIVRMMTALMPHTPLIPWSARAVSSVPAEVGIHARISNAHTVAWYFMMLCR